MEKLITVKMKQINNTDLLGISELRWTEFRHFQSENHKVYYSGHEKQGRLFPIWQARARSIIDYSAVN